LRAKRELGVQGVPKRELGNESMGKQRSMNIAFAGSEAAPFSKTGGLGDVLGALPKALAKRGHQVVVFLPAHRETKPHLKSATRLPLRVVTPDGEAEASLAVLPGPHGLRWCFVEAPTFFDRSGPYVDLDGRDFADNSDRYAFFCRAALAALEALAFTPALIHAHDWQTGLLAAYVDAGAAPSLRQPATVFTIHNLAFQGAFDFAEWRGVMLPDSFRGIDGLEFYGRFSHLKAGLVCSDLVTTVSPRYAAEIQTPEFGCGMDGLLRHLSHRLVGIVNGIDDELWNPETDPHLAAQYGRKNWREGKRANKRALAPEWKLKDPETRPLVAMIGRLALQKGFDLLASAADDVVERGANLAVLATAGSIDLEGPLRHLAHRRPDHVFVEFALDESLAHRLFAAADVMVVPSRFEPCGLTQLYGMRYGAVPVARAIGGLADTVIDAHPATLAMGLANGFVFERASPGALNVALQRALLAMENDALWGKVVERGMSRESSWDHVSQAYEAAYEDAIRRRVKM
jgi:starch synthase